MPIVANLLAWLPLILIAGLVLLAAVAALIVIRRLKRVTHELFGTRSLSRSARLIRESAEEPEPRSLQSMERLVLPQLARDFPELNVEAMRADILELLENVITGRDESHLPERMRTLCQDWWQDFIAPHEGQGEIRGGPVHRVVIKSYEPTPTRCSLCWQAAFGFQISGSSRQGRVDLEYVYALQTGDGAVRDGVHQLKCPNCGAPVARRGEKICAYCGTQLNADWMLTWRLAALRSS